MYSIAGRNCPSHDVHAMNVFFYLTYVRKCYWVKVLIYYLYEGDPTECFVLHVGNCLQLCFQPSRSFFSSYVANESLCSRQCDVIIIYSFQKVATAVILINYGEFFCSIIVFYKKHVYAFVNSARVSFLVSHHCLAPSVLICKLEHWVQKLGWQKERIDKFWEPVACKQIGRKLNMKTLVVFLVTRNLLLKV